MADNLLDKIEPDSIVNNLISNAIWIVGAVAFTFIWLKVLRYFNRRWTVSFAPKLAIPQVVLFFAILYFSPKESYGPLIVFALISVGLQIWFLRDFIRLGILDAFYSTKSGIDFKNSLNLARNSLSFLGIGAHKLTGLNEFRDAIERCAQSGRTARFLLSPPDNPLLEKLASRHGAAQDRYRKNVQESLRILSKLKAEGFNIEVKHYAVREEGDFQKFRLLIIDESICVVSWTVWSKTMGLDNPQLILKRRSNDGTVRSLASAYSDYFESIWEDPNSTIVDLDTFNV